jgi:hypothetical protein
MPSDEQLPGDAGQLRPQVFRRGADAEAASVQATNRVAHERGHVAPPGQLGEREEAAVVDLGAVGVGSPPRASISHGREVRVWPP